jgi:putative methionine-R-sulfoxide reductase with GAF domain
VTVDPTPDRWDALHDLRSMTDVALAHLDVEELIEALLGRVKQLLEVDTVTVLLLDPYGHELIATASIGLEEEVTQGVRLPVGGGFAGRIAATRTPLQLPEVKPSAVLNPILIDRGISSVLGVPMMAAGHLLGVVHVGSMHPRTFTDAEVDLLQMAAERMALATRMRLAELDRTTTVALQRSLLPARHFELTGLTVAARYVPGARAAVGGDWYDAFALPSGYTGVVIGDVAGHGLRAAVVMGRIRSALRAYALESDDPADVLQRLDRKISRFEPGAMATAMYAVITPDLTTVRLSVAGHPPPIIAEPNRASHVLEVRPDLPLGIRPSTQRRITEAPFPAGGLMLLYTDGLVERRDADLRTRVEKLRDSIVAGHVEMVCARVMSVMLGVEAAPDDVAVLAIAHDQPSVRSVG